MKNKRLISDIKRYSVLFMISCYLLLLAVILIICDSYDVVIPVPVVMTNYFNLIVFSLINISIIIFGCVVIYLLFAKSKETSNNLNNEEKDDIKIRNKTGFERNVLGNMVVAPLCFILLITIPLAIPIIVLLYFLGEPIVKLCFSAIGVIYFFMPVYAYFVVLKPMIKELGGECPDDLKCKNHAKPIDTEYCSYYNTLHEDNFIQRTKFPQMIIKFPGGVYVVNRFVPGIRYYKFLFKMQRFAHIRNCPECAAAIGKCPHCGSILDEEHIRNERCPHCGKQFYSWM